jgi:AcrR family transcriptional regulator
MLREEKKLRTRQAITEAAFALFAADGFDAVTVAAVARASGVSEATVFNYFKTKEDLVFGRLEEFEAGLVEAVRNRPPGQPIVTAFGGFLLHRHGLLGSARPEDRERLVTVSRIINQSAALRARERQVYDDSTRALAALLADESNADPGDVRPQVIANALIGVHRAAVDLVRAEVLSGRAPDDLGPRVRAQVESALALLERGLATE